MTLTTLWLFLSTYAVVFLLGFQSLNVNRGNTFTAFCTSICIGVANLAVLKLGVHAEGWDIAAYIAGGPLGIISSIHFFRWYRRQLV